MDEPDALHRIMASLYGIMLDDTVWPATSALIDDACGLTANGLPVREGPEDDVRATSGSGSMLLRRSPALHLHQICRKQSISRQADPVRLVLSLAQLA